MSSYFPVPGVVAGGVIGAANEDGGERDADGRDQQRGGQVRTIAVPPTSHGPIKDPAEASVDTRAMTAAGASTVVPRC
jgi:hypothetical protein